MLLMGLMTFTNQRRRMAKQKELETHEQLEDQNDQETAAEADKAEGTGEAKNLDRLTDEQYEEVMKNGDNVKAELTRLGVEFDKKAKVDDLRELLNEVLVSKGMMP